MNTAEIYSDLQVFKPTERPFGIKWNEWISYWWHWCFSNPYAESPAEDRDGHPAIANQPDSKVFFLAGTMGGKAERVCMMNDNKSLFFPIVNDLISFAEYPHLKSEYELREYARSDLDTTNYLEARIDNQVLDLKNICRCQSLFFELLLPINEEKNLVVKSTMAISDGYWVFLKKLSKGVHKIYFRGEKMLFDDVQHDGYKGEKGLFVNKVEYTIVVH
jgi:hypothetical protein